MYLRPMDQILNYPNFQKLKFTTFDNALKQTFEWFRNHKDLL